MPLPPSKRLHQITVLSVAPLIGEVHRAAAAAVASGDPARFLAARYARAPPPPGVSAVGAGAIQDLFDAIAGP